MPGTEQDTSRGSCFLKGRSKPRLPKDIFGATGNRTLDRLELNSSVLHRAPNPTAEDKEGVLIFGINIKVAENHSDSLVPNPSDAKSGCQA